MTQAKGSIQELTEIALFTAVMAVCSQIAIPLPNGVPLTLQTFAVALAGYYLGPRKGPIALAVYILLGAIGLPIFANFKAGAGVLFGVTGGFIWGFLAFAFAAGLGRRKSAFLAIVLGTVGLLICHGLGVLQFSFLTGNPLPASVIALSLPFIGKDFLSVVLAFFFSRQLMRRRPSIS